MTIRDQLTHDRWFAERELQQTSNAMRPAPARGRHAVKRVRHTAHPMLESTSRFFVPSIAVSSAHADLLREN